MEIVVKKICYEPVRASRHWWLSLFVFVFVFVLVFVFVFVIVKSAKEDGEWRLW